MRLHDVVTLEERLHRELPVGGKHGRLPPGGPHLPHVERVEQLGQRAERRVQRRRVGVHVDERAPAPRVDLALDEMEVVGIECRLGEQLGLVHERVGAVEVPAPAVERADEAAAFAVAPVVDELRRPMAAGIEVRLDRVGVDAHHDDRLVEDPVLDEVARVGDLFEPARHLPHVRPKVLALELEEVGRVVPRRGDAFRVGNREGMHRTNHGAIRSRQTKSTASAPDAFTMSGFTSRSTRAFP